MQSMALVDDIDISVVYYENEMLGRLVLLIPSTVPWFVHVQYGNRELWLLMSMQTNLPGSSRFGLWFDILKLFTLNHKSLQKNS